MPLARRRLFDVIPDPVDDISRPTVISYDIAERFPYLAQGWWASVQKMQGRTGVKACRSDRLLDFVSQRCGQFSHHAQAIHVGEIRLQLAQLLMLVLRALPF